MLSRKSPFSICRPDWVMIAEKIRQPYLAGANSTLN